MKTPLTTNELKTRVSPDTRERWSQIETWISGEVEQRIRAKLRHILLGCSSCRQDEIAHVLVKERGLTHGEAAMVMEFLADEYRRSPEGECELRELAEGKEPFLPHDPTNDEPTGPPTCNVFEYDRTPEPILGGITRADMQAAIDLYSSKAVSMPGHEDAGPNRRGQDEFQKPVERS